MKGPLTVALLLEEPRCAAALEELGPGRLVSGDLAQYLGLDPSPCAVEEFNDLIAEFLLEALVAGEKCEGLPGLVIERGRKVRRQD